MSRSLEIVKNKVAFVSLTITATPRHEISMSYLKDSYLVRFSVLIVFLSIFIGYKLQITQLPRLEFIGYMYAEVVTHGGLKP
jgi:hypothetical protein